MPLLVPLVIVVRYPEQGLSCDSISALNECMFELSTDQMRRIEEEERAKLAEEQYRAKVREDLLAGYNPETCRLNSRKLCRHASVAHGLRNAC